MQPAVCRQPPFLLVADQQVPSPSRAKRTASGCILATSGTGGFDHFKLPRAALLTSTV